jgi:hypothetical protein
MSSLLLCIDLRYSHVGIFDTAMRTSAPLTPSLWFTSPFTPPLPKVKVQYTQTVCGWLGGGGGGGYLVVLETIFCRSLTLCF